MTTSGSVDNPVETPVYDRDRAVDDKALIPRPFARPCEPVHRWG
jgi:hypothetical protein